eukprot:TRINITY_DN13336_c0_g1_i1.p1 TRINITY_DN13336_c0_g1~~TRINITY_DN13336_c0_g1_i1.p1  ORF type:complete len:57 (+),score=4.47 TRINITY_DN13336_c0_g1_i1:353-523(+)
MDWIRKLNSIQPVRPKSYSLEEISKHNTEDSAWLVLQGIVFDVTPTLNIIQVALMR